MAAKTSLPPRMPLDLVEIEEKFNPRDFSDPENTARIVELADSIRTQGVLVPITVRRVSIPHGKSRVVLSQGETRLRACRLLAEEGHPIATLGIPYYEEPPGISDKDRMIAVLSTNEGVKPLKPLERAEAIARLTKFGMSIEEISKAAGMSRGSVNNDLLLNSAPEAAKELVRQDIVAPSTVIELTRENRGDTVAVLELAQGVAEAQKGAGAKVEQKHVKAAKKGAAKPDTKINGALAKDAIKLLHDILDYKGDSVAALQQWACDFLSERDLPLEPALPPEPKQHGRKAKPASEVGNGSKKKSGKKGK